MFFRKTRRRFNTASSFLLLAMLYYVTEHWDSIFHTFELLCFVVVFFTGMFFLLKFIYLRLRYGKKEYDDYEIEERIRSMSPREFEIFCANLLSRMDKYISAKPTEASCDGGRDIIATNEDFKKVYVECKHYREDNSVGRPMLQKLIGSSIGDNVSLALFITTSYYTDEALEYADKVDWLELWNMKDLIKAMREVDKQWFVLYNLKEA